MSDIKDLLQRHLNALRLREDAALEILPLRSEPKKRPDLAAKLPETERRLQEAVNRWTVRYSREPSAYSKDKLDKAKARLANTQRQIAKLKAAPLVKQRTTLHKQIAELEYVLSVIARYEEADDAELLQRLTERYVIDSITGVITMRSSGMPIKSDTLTVGNQRIALSKAQRLMGAIV